LALIVSPVTTATGSGMHRICQYWRLLVAVVFTF